MATICQARLNQVQLPCWGEVVLQKVLIKVGRCLKMLQISCVPVVSRILQVAREGKKRKRFLILPIYLRVSVGLTTFTVLR